MLFIGVQDGLGIGMRAVAMPGLFQRRPQRQMVVDFTVEGDPERTGFVAHRLVAASDIDDAQPPLAKMRPGVVIKAKIVQAAMANGLGHAPQDPNATIGGLGRYKSGNPAHA